MVKLDTATGQAWLYANIPLPVAEGTNGKAITAYAGGWSPIEAVNESAIWKLHRQFTGAK